jgi:hypothetical protein
MIEHFQNETKFVVHKVEWRQYVFFSEGTLPPQPRPQDPWAFFIGIGI